MRTGRLIPSYNAVAVSLWEKQVLVLLMVLLRGLGNICGCRHWNPSTRNHLSAFGAPKFSTRSLESTLVRGWIPQAQKNEKGKPWERRVFLRFGKVWLPRRAGWGTELAAQDRRKREAGQGARF